MLLAATIERRRKSETIRQDARFLGLIAAMFSVMAGKRIDLTKYFEALREKDGRSGGEIRDPEQMRLALMAWCAASGGKIVQASDEATKRRSDEG